MHHAFARMLERTCRTVVACLLLALLQLCLSSAAFAIGAADVAATGSNPPRIVPQRSSDGAGQAPTTKNQAEGPRNPYDMEALRRFDAGSHRGEEPG